MKKKALALCAIVLFAIILSALGCLADPRLQITNVDLTVDQRSQDNVQNGSSAELRARPGSDIGLSIDVQNLYPDNEKTTIKNIDATVIIEKIDLDNDIYQNLKEFDLIQGAAKTVSAYFQVPIAVDEGGYDVKITVEGQDENSTYHTDEFDFKISVVKHSRDLLISKAQASPANISCGKTAELAIDITNIGTKEEGNASFRVKSDGLGIDNSIKTPALDNDPSSDASRYPYRSQIRIPDKINAGQYFIGITSYYDTIPTDMKNITIIVQCGNVQQQTAQQTVQQQGAAQDAGQAANAAGSNDANNGAASNENAGAGSSENANADNSANAGADNDADLGTGDAATEESGSSQGQAQALTPGAEQASDANGQQGQGAAFGGTNHFQSMQKPFSIITDTGRKSFFDSPGYLITLVMIDVILASGIIFLILKMQGKK